VRALARLFPVSWVLTAIWMLATAESASNARNSLRKIFWFLLAWPWKFQGDF
jgi:hypothetical protein